METLEQKRNREMAHILMVACLLSMLKQWRVKQEKYEEWERIENKTKQPKKKQTETSGLIQSLAFMLGLDN